MKEIRFTIEDSPLWHSLYFDYELSNEVRDDLLFAYIITQELRIMGVQKAAKKFMVFDENHQLIAKSEDISEIAKLKHTSHDTEII